MSTAQIQEALRRAGQRLLDASHRIDPKDWDLAIGLADDDLSRVDAALAVLLQRVAATVA